MSDGEGQKILEIGPGLEAFGKLLKKHSIKYLSVDLFSESDIRMDAMTLGFRNDVFDSVICIFVLEYLEDDRSAIQEIYRVLKPGNGHHPSGLEPPIEGDQRMAI